MARHNVVVDTNVPLAATGTVCPDPACTENCLRTIEELMEHDRLVLDDKWLILTEYRDNLVSTGQPTIASSFLKWILTNHTNIDRCLKVTITPTAGGSFLEFPADPELNDFDPADRKFIATATVAEPLHAVFQGTDSGWWRYTDVFDRLGIPVHFLCVDYVSGIHDRKHAGDA